MSNAHRVGCLPIECAMRLRRHGRSRLVPRLGVKGEELDNVAISPHTPSSTFEGRMVTQPDDVFRQQARVLRALANESRLKIVDRLSRGECSVGELTDLIGSDHSTVSKHLAVLRAHGVVSDRREGNVVYYTLLTPCVMDFFSCATQLLKERV
ncbi:ArsR/SmtB family transcription factor [Myxococcota bacterium]